jgi:hypothetical protein
MFPLLLGCARAQSTPPIFNTKADAHRDIARGIALAAKTKKNGVLMFGSNW